MHGDSAYSGLWKILKDNHGLESSTPRPILRGAAAQAENEVSTR